MTATSPMCRLFRIRQLAIITFVCACAGCPSQAQRRDVVVMKNGDHFTGQVKRLKDGLLFVETAYASGNIGLDWNQVESVQSTASYQIVLNNGQRLVGKIEKNSSENADVKDFVIREVTGEVEVPSASVVKIDSNKPTFWRQLQGSVDVGYSFTSGNSQSTFNADTSAMYRARRWESATSLDATFSGQSGGSQTNREDMQETFSLFLGRNSFVSALSDFLHSSQQDLTLRATLGGGYGRFLIRTINNNLSWLGGLAYINESFVTTTGKPSGQSLEAVAGLQYDFVRFNFGEFHSQLRVFPGLTDSGRVRSSVNNSLTIKLRNNFHLSFTFWDNFDSRPPATAKRNELGTSTGIGWSF
jgi:putative salt-induced outer membrane protein YdiY